MMSIELNAFPSSVGRRILMPVIDYHFVAPRLGMLGNFDHYRSRAASPVGPSTHKNERGKNVQ
jgi:hypothetical protein